MRICSSYFHEGATPSDRGQQEVDSSQTAMLELAFKDGSSAAFSYGYLYRVDFNGTDVARLHFLHDVVTIRGKHLGATVRAIHRQQQGRIDERDPLQNDLDQTLVHEISITRCDANMP
jgi:hypothetical protein